MKWCACLCVFRGYLVGQVCKSCASGCTSCEKNATHCLSCEETLLLHKHECVERCPPGHTVRNRECVHCPESCVICSEEGLCTGETEIHHNFACFHELFFYVKKTTSYKDVLLMLQQSSTLFYLYNSCHCQNVHLYLISP